MASSRGLQVVKAALERSLQAKNFGKFFKDMNYISAGDGKCKAEFVVAEEHLNIYGSLHGGCTSTIIDYVSYQALITDEKVKPGVSFNLHVLFLNSAFPGDTIVVDAKTIKVGKKLAFMTAEMTKKDDDKIIARGELVMTMK